ncbi:putative cysteine desulfurase [Posidoniimonas polymericola]|uniref:cysteine desulfurase n=1 Tax=Posidoniimonas polymericola TaxID=2528002 RepID=A0A5C5Y098_9BACT|nr:aminotransferase class V-fold PLP-dependent enzyme [Posidoniimonas polymericola]TWT67655.1 putative cysteine desulfurase [Posidoniimonas polymericola]
MARIYLDNAATSWPKPPQVVESMAGHLRDDGGSAGRGGHASAMGAQRIVDRAREVVGRLIGAEQPSCIAFLHNGTDALNTAIHGVLGRGDHVVTTVCEHNSVLRPLHHAERRLGCELTVVDCDDSGRVDAERLLAAVRPDTRLVALTHASNVTGALQPIEAVAAGLRDRDTLLLVDAAQSAGHARIDVQAFAIDLLAAPGHKGLLGPTGTGFLYVRPGVERQLTPLRQGGTGGQSDLPVQPTEMPTLLECGNANVVGLAGLVAGVEHVLEVGVDVLGTQIGERTRQLIDGLLGLPGCRLFGPTECAERVGVVSLLVDGYDPHELAALLELSAGVESRAGLHCAPQMHRRLGTSQGGTLRLSSGVFTTEDEIEQVVAAIAAVAAG